MSYCSRLNDAIVTAKSGTQGTVSQMHETERVVLSVFNLIKAYVELVANGTADPKSVIESAGLSVITSGGNAAVSELTLSALGNGVVELTVPRNKGEASFIYQYSSDGGTTWQEFEQSKLATVLLKGQTPGTTLHFRFAAVGKTKGAFSQAKSVMVV